MELRKLTPEYDAPLAALVRKNLEAHELNLPGTVYYDRELDHLSEYYSAEPEKRAYFILLEQNELVGGIGYAAYAGFDQCAELQKLYLDDRVKGRGLGYRLIGKVEEAARGAGYRRMYLETHTNLRPRSISMKRPDTLRLRGRRGRFTGR